MKLIECKTKDEVIDNFLIRKKVFIEEQKVAYDEEYDLLEKDARLYLVLDDNGKAVSCSRLFIEEDEEGIFAHIGRIATLKEERGKGYARFMLLEIEKIVKNEGVKRILLHAQATALSFYEIIGYQTYGKLYYEANMAHMMMRKLI